jgi:hypothetical protein
MTSSQTTVCALANTSYRSRPIIYKGEVLIFILVVSL